MVAADALAIGIGALLGTRLPERAIKVFAAVAFVVFGAVLLAEGLASCRRRRDDGPPRPSGLTARLASAGRDLMFCPGVQGVVDRELELELALVVDLEQREAVGDGEQAG